MFSTTLGLLAREGGDGPRFLFPLLMLLLLGGLVAWLVRRRRGDEVESKRSALGTLQDRFARGEIDKAEFDHRRAVLDGADVVPPAPPRTSPTTGGTATDTMKPDAPGDVGSEE